MNAVEPRPLDTEGSGLPILLPAVPTLGGVMPSNQAPWTASLVLLQEWRASTRARRP